MTEILVGVVGFLFFFSLILCGLYVVMRWPGDETQDTSEEMKNRRIAAELERLRKGGDE